MPQRPISPLPDQGFLDLIQAIVAGDITAANRLLDTSPSLVRARAMVGAARNGAESYFYEPIAHYMYKGDTALHMAAAGFRHEIAQTLIDLGADCSARNRRGAEPLHYAADSNIWSPASQAATIRCLIQAGADPNAADNSNVTPLHRAVRTRCAAAVQALLAAGADPRGKNGSGSTPLHLAIQNTGRGGSGTPHAVEQQREIIGLLLEAGATPNDRNAIGITVREVVTADWIRALFQTRPSLG